MFSDKLNNKRVCPIVQLNTYGPSGHQPCSLSTCERMMRCHSDGSHKVLIFKYFKLCLVQSLARNNVWKLVYCKWLASCSDFFNRVWDGIKSDLNNSLWVIPLMKVFLTVLSWTSDSPACSPLTVSELELQPLCNCLLNLSWVPNFLSSYFQGLVLTSISLSCNTATHYLPCLGLFQLFICVCFFNSSSSLCPISATTSLPLCHPKCSKN